MSLAYLVRSTRRGQVRDTEQCWALILTARSVRIAFASAALTNSIRGSAFISPPVFPRVLAFIVIGSGVSLAISGRSSIEPLAILIQPPQSVSYSDSTIGSSRSFLRKARIKRAATQEFHEVNFLDRDAYLGGLACSRELARS